MPLRILSWNIQHGGGRRAPAISRALTSWNPDCAVLTEFRATRPSRTIAAHLANLGLTHQLDTARAHAPKHNGLLVASRFPLTPLPMTGILAELGRWLPVEVHAPMPFHLIGMGIPSRDTKRMYEFHDATVVVLAPTAHALGLAIGDTNTGLPHVDEEGEFFEDRDHEWFSRLANTGWIDAYRTRFPMERVFTWHNPANGRGFRIDQAFATHTMNARIQGIRYDWADPERPSDHAAVVVDLDDG